MAEYFDVIDASGVPLGYTKRRGSELAPGEYHLVTAVWVVNSEGKLLITRRSHSKDAFPDMWENTSGYVQNGETSHSAAARELSEETGIDAPVERFQYLGSLRSKHTIADTYVLEWDALHTKEDLILQAEEVQNADIVYADTIEKMIDDGLFAYPVVLRLRDIVKPLNQIIKKYTHKLFKE